MKITTLISIQAMAIAGIAWAIKQHLNLQEEVWITNSNGISFHFLGKDCFHNIEMSRYCFAPPKFLGAINACLHITLGACVCTQKIAPYMTTGIVCSLIAFTSFIFIVYEKRVQDYKNSLRNHIRLDRV